jgi:protein gp37
MGKETGISWTDHTFNCWIGCARVSPGCAHCYAADLAKNRMGLDVWDGKEARPRKMMSEAYWKQPAKWNREAERDGVRRRVFCASMADVFEDRPELVAIRERLWQVTNSTPRLDWLILTKRPENIAHIVPHHWMVPEVGFPANLWIGTSVENQHWADIRIPALLQIPAKVRFLSCEPLVGAVDLNKAAWGEGYPRPPMDVWARQIAHDGIGWQSGFAPLQAIDWVIVGGESGPKHRPMHLDWARDIRAQCEAANVAFFFKQIGGRTSKSGGDLLDGQQYHAWPQSPMMEVATHGE